MVGTCQSCSRIGRKLPDCVTYGPSRRRAHGPVCAPWMRHVRVRREHGVSAPGSGAASSNDRACRPTHLMDDSAFPPPDVAAARSMRSLLVSKAISRFARYPDRRPSGLISADDGSIDMHELWLHWGRHMQHTRQQLSQSITERTFGNRGRRRFLLRSDDVGRTWVSVSGPASRFPRNHRRRPPSRFTSRAFCFTTGDSRGFRR